MSTTHQTADPTAQKAAAQADPGPGQVETPILAVSRPAAIALQAVLDGLPRTGLLLLIAAAFAVSILGALVAPPLIAIALLLVLVYAGWSVAAIISSMPM